MIQSVRKIVHRTIFLYKRTIIAGVSFPTVGFSALARPTPNSPKSTPPEAKANDPLPEGAQLSLGGCSLDAELVVDGSFSYSQMLFRGQMSSR